MRIAIINSAFQKPFFRTRWVDFANKYKDVEIYLITPREREWGRSESLTYGFADLVKADSFDDKNLHLITVKHSDCITNGWKSYEFKKVLKQIKPDIIYHIGSHTQNPLFQIIRLKKKYFKKTTLIAFSMRGTNTNKKSRISLIKQEKNIIKKILRIPMYLLDLNRLKRFNKYVDCVTCHYPDAKDLFIKEGFTKRISIQTQVGVNCNVFFPDKIARKEIRDKYNLGDAFVFGSASRFHYSKGLFQIIDALNFDGNWKYLLIGSGTDEQIKAIQQKIKERQLEDKVILTGYIETENMPKYWNALDCAIHFPLSTPKWIETFSLALVQAMATKKAVIGSSSGSVPYQIGPDGCVVEEGNSNELSRAMQKMMNNESYRVINSQNMYKRAVNTFSSSSLNKQFYDLINELQSDKIKKEEYRK